MFDYDELDELEEKKTNEEAPPPVKAASVPKPAPQRPVAANVPTAATSSATPAKSSAASNAPPRAPAHQPTPGFMRPSPAAGTMDFPKRPGHAVMTAVAAPRLGGLGGRGGLGGKGMAFQIGGRHAPLPGAGKGGAGRGIGGFGAITGKGRGAGPVFQPLGGLVGRPRPGGAMPGRIPLSMLRNLPQGMAKNGMPPFGPPVGRNAHSVSPSGGYPNAGGSEAITSTSQASASSSAVAPKVEEKQSTEATAAAAVAVEQEPEDDGPTRYTEKELEEMISQKKKAFLKLPCAECNAPAVKRYKDSMSFVITSMTASFWCDECGRVLCESHRSQHKCEKRDAQRAKILSMAPEELRAQIQKEAAEKVAAELKAKEPTAEERHRQEMRTRRQVIAEKSWWVVTFLQLAARDDQTERSDNEKKELLELYTTSNRISNLLWSEFNSPTLKGIAEEEWETLKATYARSVELLNLEIELDDGSRLDMTNPWD